MSSNARPVRVLYSFPLKLGADRICYTAWQQVKFFVFDCSQKSGADARFFRDLIERDASKFPGFFETGSKVCHQVNEWAVSLRLATAS